MLKSLFFCWAVLMSVGAVGAGEKGFYIPGEAKSGEIVEVYLWDKKIPEPFQVRILNPKGVTLYRAQSFPFFVHPGVGLQVAILPMDTQWEAGDYLVELALTDRSPVRRFIHLVSKTYAAEDLTLSPSLSALRSKPDPRKDKEAQEIWKIYLQVKTTSFFDHGLFKHPLEGPFTLTGGFGDRRRFIYSDGQVETSVHSGLDFGAAPGQPIFSCAAGRVVLAKDRLLTGLTVVIEHLPGLYSVYFHMQKLLVLPNEMILRGQTLGLLGDTGLSTAPHLHWELRLGGIPLDPQPFLERGVLDKAAITAILRVTQ